MPFVVESTRTHPNDSTLRIRKLSIVKSDIYLNFIYS